MGEGELFFGRGRERLLHRGDRVEFFLGRRPQAGMERAFGPAGWLFMGPDSICMPVLRTFGAEAGAFVTTVTTRVTGCNG